MHFFCTLIPIPETLLLLEALTHGHPAIAKIVAFEGAFEKLLALARNEADLIIVEDCLRLINNMLEGNYSNQVNILLLIACFFLFRFLISPLSPLSSLLTLIALPTR